MSNGNNVLVVLKAKDVHNEDALITIANGDILWSWHIWLTNYKPGVNGISENGAVHKYEGVAFTSGKYVAIMDRNLGSTYQELLQDSLRQRRMRSNYMVSSISGDVKIHFPHREMVLITRHCLFMALITVNIRSLLLK